MQRRPSESSRSQEGAAPPVGVEHEAGAAGGEGNQLFRVLVCLYTYIGFLYWAWATGRGLIFVNGLFSLSRFLVYFR